MTDEIPPAPSCSGRWFMLASVNILCGFLTGFAPATITLALDPITFEFKLSEFQQGIVTSSILLGGAIGSLVGGPLANYLGRKKVMFLSGLFTLLGSVASGVSPLNYFALSAFRIVVGLGIGLVGVVAPMYVSENGPQEQRGFLGTLFQLSLTLAIFLAYLFCYAMTFLPDSYNWRIMLGSTAVSALFVMVQSFLIPESNAWFVGERRAELSVNEDAFNSRESVDRQLTSKNTLPTPRYENGLVLLFSSRYLYAVGLGLMLSICLQLTGINAVIYYAPGIFKKAGIPHEKLATIGVGAWNFVTTLLAVFLVSFFRRRTILFTSMLFICVSDAVLGFINQFVHDEKLAAYSSLVCIFVFIAAFEGGIGPLYWVLINEVSRYRERPGDKETGVIDYSVGFANLMQYCLNLLLSATFPTAVNKLHLPVVYWVFAGLGILGTAYCAVFLPETSKMELAEEEQEGDNRDTETRFLKN